MSKLDLGEILANNNPFQDVPNSGTVREQIEYIDISLIDSDPNNFYELSEVDKLAANIELCGLQQPIRVRTNPDDPNRVIIVSGHRRRAAIEKLIAEGREDLKDVPCIREQPVVSAAMQELRLIYANSDTREMTSAEKAKEVERVELLLYQLKEEGYNFPGRMRDHVAAACKISKTKLSNLKVIREGLEPKFWLPAWEQGKVVDSVALIIARLPSHHQLYCWKQAKDLPELKWYKEQSARIDSEAIQSIYKLECPDGGTCQHIDQKFECHGQHPWNGCAGRCCGDCSDLGSCEFACPKFYEQIKQIKADRREERKLARLEQEAKDRPEVELITALWARFAEAREAAGLSIEEYCKKAGIYTDERMKKAWPIRETGGKITRDTGMPYRGGNGFSLYDIRPLLKSAKVLGVSLDYLLLRTSDPKGIAAESASKKEVKEEAQSLGRCQWYTAAQFPGDKQDIIVIANDGWVTDGTFENGRLCGAGFGFDEALFWTPKPDLDGVVHDAPKPSGQLMISGWMPGGTTPAEPCEVVAAFDLGDGGKSSKQFLRWTGSEFTFKNGLKVDMEPSKWMRLPPDEEGAT